MIKTEASKLLWGWTWRVAVSIGSLQLVNEILGAILLLATIVWTVLRALREWDARQERKATADS